MRKTALILLFALLLSSAAPAPSNLPLAVVRLAPRSSVVVPRQPGRVEIHGMVEGAYPGGLVGPIGEYTAYGASLAEATINAQQLEQQIRTTATAQAVRP